MIYNSAKSAIKEKMDKPFWENTYKSDDAATFGIEPSRNIKEFWNQFAKGWKILDIGCGEGRDSIFLAEFGFAVEPFGERTYLVRAVPAVLYGKDWSATLKELLDSLTDGEKSAGGRRWRYPSPVTVPSGPGRR